MTLNFQQREVLEIAAGVRRGAIYNFMGKQWRLSQPGIGQEVPHVRRAVLLGVHGLVDGSCMHQLCRRIGKRQPMSEINKIIDDMTKKFVDEGRLVEAGWQAYRMLSIPPNAPDIQVKECRLAYFFGAQHLYSSMMGILDDGDEPTEDDMNRMELIHKELEAFIEDVKRNH